jgi:small subunit ribosomal protein S17
MSVSTEQNQERNQRKVRVGVVVSAAMNKSIVVRMDRTIKHSLYLKSTKTFSKMYAHDEANDARPGDTVRIMETRPLSKTKRWRLVEIVERAK